MFNHSFTDGIGIVNSLSFLNNENHLPKNLPEGRGLPWYIYLFYGLFFPFMLMIAIPELFPNRWKDWKMIKSPKGNSGECTNLISKEYKFDDLRKCYKRFEKRTLNHFMMGILSKSIYQWYEENGATDIQNICTIVPVGMKPLVLDIDELNMNNFTSGVTYEFPLRKQLPEAIEDAKKGFEYYFTLPYLIYTVLMVRIFQFLPPTLGWFVYQYFCRNLDLTFTNVPGHKEPMYICNKEIHRIHGFLNVYCGCNITIAVNSYNMIVTFQMTADNQLPMEPKRLLKLLEQNIDDEIAKSD